ncbi:hypothetical protein DAPPUDRAFT_238849 [Daphnia pulex]|uniref:Uncharacterized protein n=1 Tax=Daphnia pulex TaxID=6669 RepID=E9G7K9_DAPPU|nr:hypothetical protein DAPPUDRAFT_238849 [Daphnia pulex]|eukprot:EFX84629.1 hypothetical protein DAPPUDRAFT_238849 [Daphnia pulex]
MTTHRKASSSERQDEEVASHQRVVDWLCGRPARVTEHNLKRKISTKGRHQKIK